jgi:hypothetical protein
MDHLVEKVEREGHLVQFYGADHQFLASRVNSYLKDGLSRGDGIVVIATPAHSEAFKVGLRDAKEYDRALLEGRIVFLDAEITLGQIMLDGNPDRDRFRLTVGAAITSLGEQGHDHAGLCIFGEMVGILWQRKEFSAAIRLKEFWNRQLEALSCTLLFAYPIDVFSQDFQVASLDPILSTHTHLLPLRDHLEDAVSQAIHDVLGARVEGLRHIVRPRFRPDWGEIPRAQALVLWVRNNFQDQADEILGLAQQYYLATTE